MALKRVAPNFVDLKSAAKKVMKTANNNSEMLLNVPVEDVISNPQVRKTFRKIEELAESIKEMGLQQPITVSPKNAQGKYVIIQGERRWRAVQMAGLKEIRVIVRSKYTTDADRTIAQLTENIQRDDMDPVELGQALKQVMNETKLSSRQLSAKLGKSTGWVSQYVSVAEIPALVDTLRVKKDFHDVRSISALKQLFTLDSERAEKIVTNMIASDEEVTRDRCLTLLNEFKNPIEAKKPEVKKSNASSSATKIDDKHLPPPVKVEKVTKQAAGQSIPRGAQLCDEIRHIVVVSLNKQKNQYGYLAPHIVSTEEGHVCVMLNGHAIVAPIEEVTLLACCPASQLEECIKKWEEGRA